MSCLAAYIFGPTVRPLLYIIVVEMHNHKFFLSGIEWHLFLLTILLFVLLSIIFGVLSKVRIVVYDPLNNKMQII